MDKIVVRLKVFVLRTKFYGIDRIERILINILCFVGFQNLLWTDLLEMNRKRNIVYRKFQIKYAKFDPIWLREHRNYFKQDSRGFGEDAFHSYW